MKNTNLTYLLLYTVIVYPHSFIVAFCGPFNDMREGFH